MDAERKYEEVARKMNMMENDLEKAMNRAEGCEDKIVDREHELKVIGDNMKAMEVRKNHCVLRKKADLSLRQAGPDNGRTRLQHTVSGETK